MSDDVDDLLRRTMATLDRQVPAGYFDGLPARTLARLDDPAIGDDLARERALRGGGVAVAPPTANDRTDDAAPASTARRRVAVVGAILGFAAAVAVIVFVTIGDGRVPPERVARGIRHEAAQPSTATTALPVAPSSSALSAPGSAETAPDKPVAGKPGGEPLDEPLGKRPARPAGNAGKPGKLERNVDSKTGVAIEVPGAKTGKSKTGRTSLSADDFLRGMDAVAGRLRACLRGTQDSASLRLRVAPSGRVVSVDVSGLKAPRIAACVERAAAAATFPPWTGTAQTLGYTYPSP